MIEFGGEYGDPSEQDKGLPTFSGLTEDRLKELAEWQANYVTAAYDHREELKKDLFEVFGADINTQLLAKVSDKLSFPVSGDLHEDAVMFIRVVDDAEDAKYLDEQLSNLEAYPLEQLQSFRQDYEDALKDDSKLPPSVRLDIYMHIAVLDRIIAAGNSASSGS